MHNSPTPKDNLAGGVWVWLAAGLLAVVTTLGFAAWQWSAEPTHPDDYGVLPAFALTDQHGAPFGSANLDGKIWVANFIFTRCPTVCPVFTSKMAELQRAAKASQAPLEFISFSVDPAYDSPERLLAYGQGYGADFSTWRFLTGSFDTIKTTVTDGMKITMGRNSGSEVLHPESVLHGTHFVLVDGQARIRGYYDSSDNDAIERVLNDVRRLFNQASNDAMGVPSES